MESGIIMYIAAVKKAPIQKSRATGFILNSEYGSDLSFMNCWAALRAAITAPPIAIAIQKPGELVGSILSRWDFCIWCWRTQVRSEDPGAYST